MYQRLILEDGGRHIPVAEAEAPHSTRLYACIRLLSPAASEHAHTWSIEYLAALLKTMSVMV
jgi:hypothetical protein